MTLNWGEIRAFFESPLKAGKVRGVKADNIAVENQPFTANENALWVEVRVVETGTKARTDKAFTTSGAAVYTVAVPPNAGTTAIDETASAIAGLFSPIYSAKEEKTAVVRGRDKNRIIVRRVETAPGVSIDGVYKKNVRVYFDAVYYCD